MEEHIVYSCAEAIQPGSKPLDLVANLKDKKIKHVVLYHEYIVKKTYSRKL